MRKIAIALVLLSTLVVFFYLKQNTTKVNNSLVTASTPPTVLGESLDGVSFSGPYEAGMVSLIDNLSLKLTSSEAKEKYNCKVITNATFYTKQDTHIGLFVSNREIYKKRINSSLFDGFLTINSVFTPRITRDEPIDIVNGIQSGPILIENASKAPISLARDKEARRVVAAVNGDNKLIFLVFYDKNSVFSGPLLADLPEKVLEVSKNENLNIADAINLDGGAASAYIDDTLQLSELSPVGSFFCVK